MLARNPAASGPIREVGPADHRSNLRQAAALSATTGDGSRADGWRTLWARHRVVYVAVALAVVAILAATVWLVAGGDDPPGDDGRDEDFMASGNHVSTAGPGHLQVENQVEGENHGCGWKLTNLDDGTSGRWPDAGNDEYDNALLQIPQAGDFRIEASGDGCFFKPRAGLLQTSNMPFTPFFAHGDSEAFDTTGTVVVKVVNFNDDSPNATCQMTLHDAKTGALVDLVRTATVKQGEGHVRLGGQQARLPRSHVLRRYGDIGLTSRLTFPTASTWMRRRHRLVRSPVAESHQAFSRSRHVRSGYAARRAPACGWVSG